MAKIRILVLTLALASGGIVGCASSSGKASTCPNVPTVHAVGTPLRLADCAGNVGLKSLPTMYLRIGQPITVTGLVPKAYGDPTSSNPSVLKVTSATASVATLEAVHAGQATMRLVTAYCRSKPEQQSACPVLTVQVFDTRGLSTCPSGPAAQAMNELTVRLVNCDGTVGGADPPTMAVVVGNPITVTGLIAGVYGDPTSSNPTVLKVTGVSPSAATLQPERVGTAIVRLETSVCGSKPEHQNACPVMIVHVFGKANA